MKNEVQTTAQTISAPAIMDQSDFSALLQGAIGISRLAVGHKFTTDELVKSPTVTLRDFDWVDYVENAGTPNERNVHFSVWAVDVATNDGNQTISGYYQGGTVLNKLADTIESNNLRREMEKYGIPITVSWGKTNNKNDIAVITIL